MCKCDRVFCGVNSALVKKVCRKAVITAGKQLNERFGRLPINGTLVAEAAAQTARWCGEQMQEAIEAGLSPLSKYGSDFYTEYQLTEGSLVLVHLDGGAGFLYGQPNYSIGVVYRVNGASVFTGVFNPYFQEFFFAESGKLPKRNNLKIGVNAVSVVEDAFVGFAYRGDHRNDSEDVFNALFGVMRLPVRTMIPGSDLYGLSLLANGNLAAMILADVQYLHVLPGLELLKQAGGQVSDFEGKPVIENTRFILASNGVVHHALLDQLARSLMA